MGAAVIAEPWRNGLVLNADRFFFLQSASGPAAATDVPHMIVYSEEYITREMPMSLLNSWITPVEHFFVRNNEHMPTVNLNEWRLRITGEVTRPLDLSFQELLKFEPRRVTNTLECAGNGRAFFQPRISGVPWTRGGVGNAVFSGPPMGTLLRNAGVKASARHVALRGVTAPSNGAEPFVRSIPIEKAMDSDTLVATEMNGAALTPEHGFPARALIPGWIGSASIKWLTEINVMRQEFQGYYMDQAYRSPMPPVPPGNSFANAPMAVLTSLPLKSIIAKPADGSEFLASGPTPVRVFGAAWAGESAVQGVEVSTDEGSTWSPAALGAEHARYAWRLWSFEWMPRKTGTHLLMSRATDKQGRSQPSVTPWNPGGYLWNARDRIRLNVRTAQA